MEKATTVWLVRHGLPEAVHGRCYGRHDAPLSSEGVRQAQHVARELARESISHIYSSGLRRALDSARIVAEPHRLTVRTLNELAEIDFGDLDGMSYEEIEKQRPDIFQSWMTRPTETEFPNGESFRRMSIRVLAAFDSLLSRHRNQSIVVVAHAGVIRIVLCQALSIPEKEIFRLGQRYGAINKVNYFEHGSVVELMNG